MFRFVLSVADALRFRFAVSPVGEVARLARAMANPKTLSRPGCSFSAATSSASSPSSRVPFHGSGSVRLLDVS
jgi:hypothetical protein